MLSGLCLHGAAVMLAWGCRYGFAVVWVVWGCRYAVVWVVWADIMVVWGFSYYRNNHTGAGVPWAFQIDHLKTWSMSRIGKYVGSRDPVLVASAWHPVTPVQCWH